MAVRPLSVEKLLIHRRWLHRLAVHIVHDDELAHDLVQETWLAALRSAPPSDEKVRPWLAGVLRNVARMSVRTAVRRRGRERAWVDDDEALPSAEELLERLEAQELLLNEVQRLDEPYRTTILLLYFEGLPAADIADRLDVPDSTIRWRHRHALESLRKVLAEKDPERRRLKALLIPAGGAAAVAVESSTGLFGGKSVWAGLAVVLASVLSLWPGDRHERGRAAASFPALSMSLAAPAPEPAAVLPGARVLSPGFDVELQVRVTDLDDAPIAEPAPGLATWTSASRARTAALSSPTTLGRASRAPARSPWRRPATGRPRRAIAWPGRSMSAWRRWPALRR